MRLTAALWIGVIVVVLAVVITGLIMPGTEEGETDSPPTDYVAPGPDDGPVSGEPPKTEPPRPGETPDAEDEYTGDITITQFQFDKNKRVIDISMVVKGMRKKGVVSLPKLSYDCKPSAPANITVAGLENLFSNISTLNISLYMNDTMLEDISRQMNEAAAETQRCEPKVDTSESGTKYIYGFSENIITTRRGRIVDELTFYGIKDLNFRGEMFQEEIQISNQVVVPNSLDSGTYVMNITVIDKLSFLQDSIIKEFEV